MIPVIPQPANNWLSMPNAQAALGSFPANLIQYLDEATQKEIILYINQNYAWPQVLERRPFESMWDTITEMYRIRMDKIDLSVEEGSKTAQTQLAENDASSSGTKVRVADSVLFDAVERLTDIHHFVSFKEGMPIQFNIPKYFDNRSEDNFYHPFKDRIQSANALLAWNFDNQDIFRKHAIITRHFYTYGVAFALSEFEFLVQMIQRMRNDGSQTVVPEIMKIGTTFEPLSIRKLWLNYRLNSFDMDYQPCPFLFNETPRFATLQNVYNPQTNPFGFLNLDKLAGSGNIDWLYSEPEMASLRKVMEDVIALQSKSGDIGSQAGAVMPNLMKAEHSVEAIWTYFPMLPLDPQTLEWKKRADGSPVGFHRYIVNQYGQNLAGKQILLRLQRNFYPRDSVPIYGTSHMPDLDSGVYTPSLGYLLWNHYKEIVTCKAQYIANKDWVNNPPAWVNASSPASTQDLNRSGAKIEVNGPNDFGWRQPYDATGSTVNMMTALREQSKTTSKSDDALMGKALGGRTSATEANNAFQASMSAVTTPINLFNFDIMGGFAIRVWEYTGTWFPPELLKRITGSMGFVLTPEDLWTRVGLKWDVGSTYVESIVRQQNIRYILESSMGDPAINRAPMWRELLNEWRFDSGGDWVNDGGFEREVYVATNQAINTFYGKPVFVNPDQNHQIALKVKTRFIEDTESVFMTDPNFSVNAPRLIQQIQIHQQFITLQLHQQLLMQQMAAHGGNPMALPGMESSLQSQQPPLQAPQAQPTGGNQAQAVGGTLG